MRRFGIVGLGFVVVALAIMVGIMVNDHPPIAPPTGSSDTVPGSVSAQTLPNDVAVPMPLTGSSGGFANVAERITPAVVNISSERVVTTRRRVPTPFGWDPFFEFFGRRRYRSVPEHQRETSLGSGVIVDPQGVILTANHVVEGATDIRVTLADGATLPAELLGTDPATDVAVLKVDGQGLPVVPIGNSDQARIGDVVLAFGNPFGIGQTVTMGIISATGRSDVGLVDYENFIQTDAAINPGNSGGALVDVSGRLIGINTAIFSKSGGYQGIGFAVPINMARSVMDGVIATGSVQRGWVGLSFQDLDPSLADAFGMPDVKGALVNEVLAGSPADEAGIRRGDVIISFNESPITGATALRRLIALAPVGSKIALGVQRGQETSTVRMLVDNYETEYTYIPADHSEESVLEGLVVEELDRRTASRIGLKPQTRGVIVKDILAGSPAVQSGLWIGDAILEINREPVDGVAKFRSLLREREGQSAVLLLSRRGALYYLTIPG